MKNYGKNIAESNTVTSEDMKNPLVLSICSGKGGVGKSFASSNLAWILAESGLQVLVWDADMMFPNLHLIIGVEPSIRLSQVYSGNVRVEQAIYRISSNLDLLADMPAAGITEYYFDNPIREVRNQIMLLNKYDVIILDTPAGAPRQVIEAISISDLILLTITDEPTSLLDSYALYKIIIATTTKEKIKLFVNNVIDYEDAEEVNTKMNLATKQFLNTELEMIGYVPYSREVRNSIIKQELIAKTDKDGEVTNFLKIIADNIKSMVLQLV